MAARKKVNLPAVVPKPSTKRDAKGYFKKGEPRPVGAGRVKGSKNKFTRDMKDATLEAFNELGGKNWLIKMAKGSSSTRRAMIQFFGKMIPLDSRGTSNPDDAAAAIRERVKQMKEAGG